jgi:hypothetical protein
LENPLNITHIDLAPVIYGFAVFLGLYITVWKFSKGKWLSMICDVIVFYVVFSMHNHSTTGGLVAAIAAMLAGLFFPSLIKRAFAQTRR